MVYKIDSVCKTLMDCGKLYVTCDVMFLGLQEKVKVSDIAID